MKKARHRPPKRSGTIGAAATNAETAVIIAVTTAGGGANGAVTAAANGGTAAAADGAAAGASGSGTDTDRIGLQAPPRCVIEKEAAGLGPAAFHECAA